MKLQSRLVHELSCKGSLKQLITRWVRGSAKIDRYVSRSLQHVEYGHSPTPPYRLSLQIETKAPNLWTRSTNRVLVVRVDRG